MPVFFPISILTLLGAILFGPKPPFCPLDGNVRVPKEPHFELCLGCEEPTVGDYCDECESRIARVWNDLSDTIARFGRQK